MDPLSAYRQKLEQQQKLKKQKKANPVGIYVAVGAGALLLIGLIIYANSGTPSSGKTQSGPTDAFTADVNLAESQKMALYSSLMARKEMLTPLGSVNRAYETLAGEYRVSVSAVQAVEREGKSKGWPHK